MVAEYVDENNDGTPERTRIYWILPIIDQRIGFVDIDGQGNKTFYYYLCDQVGSVMQVVNESGTVVNQYDYDAFGNRIDANTFEGVENRYQFQGREYDAHRKDYYFRNRCYIPEWGVFTSPDARLDIESGGPCNYLFADNSPLNGIDPQGLASVLNPLSWPGKIVQVAGGLLCDTGLPVIRGVGQTLTGAGKWVEAPATLVETTAVGLTAGAIATSDNLFGTRIDPGKTVSSLVETKGREFCDEIVGGGSNAGEGLARTGKDVWVVPGTAAGVTAGTIAYLISGGPLSCATLVFNGSSNAIELQHLAVPGCGGEITLGHITLYSWCGPADLVLTYQSQEQEKQYKVLKREFRRKNRVYKEALNDFLAIQSVRTIATAGQLSGDMTAHFLSTLGTLSPQQCPTPPQRPAKPKYYEEVAIGTHAAGHVPQWEMYGPLFPFVYFWNGGASVRNWMERECDQKAKSVFYRRVLP